MTPRVVADHLPEEVLIRYGEGSLPDAELAATREHLADCTFCQDRAAFIAKVPSTTFAPTKAPFDESAAFVPPLPRGTLVGRYVLIDRIGVGGMGQVYSAYDPELDRRVAIKLLRPRRSKHQHVVEDQARLMREAQAMARLSHPNVVTVYDVGVYQDGIFLAMELVEGQTLKEFVEEAHPTWRIVLAMFVEAGRGLAAAHAAGIVHRDFKPQNVLIGTDRRIRVTDFGLARAAGRSGEPASSASAATPNLELDPLSSTLTAAGAVIGTPGYMSAEQIRGDAVDTRSDQFSFCVALYEALYRQLPFVGRSLSELRSKLEQGEVQPGGRGAHVPLWLRRIVLRGLEPNPADRFASMDDLLNTVVRRSRVSRWSAATLLGIGALAAVIGPYRLVAGAADARCSTEAKRAAQVWSPASRDAVRQRFEASGLSYARDSFTGVARTLDTWTNDWVERSTALCEDTRREAPSEVLKRKRGCLDDRLSELRHTVGVLAAADDKVVMLAVEAASDLTPARNCMDTNRLAGPPTAESPAEAARLSQLRDRLIEARSLYASGRYAPSAQVAQALVDEIGPSHRSPLLAESLTQLGIAQADAGDPQTGIRTLEKADFVAEENGMDWLRAQIAVQLVYDEYIAPNPEAGLRWAEAAHARLIRVGDDAGLRTDLTSYEADIAGDQGRLQEALRGSQSALELARATYGPVHPKVSRLTYNVAAASEELGLFEQALAAAEQAVATDERVYGKSHPSSAVSEALRARLLIDMGDYEGGLPLAERELARIEKDLGPEHFRVGESALDVGEGRMAEGDTAGALVQLRRAKDIARASFGANSDSFAIILNSEGQALYDAGNKTEAVATVTEALKILEGTRQRTYYAGAPLRSLGDFALRDGRFDEASGYYHRALSLEEPAFGSNNPSLALPLTGLGEAALGLKDTPAALNALERAVKVRQGHRVPKELEARTLFALARALWEQGTDRDRAIRVAGEAREAFGAGAKRDRPEADRVGKWLAARK